MVKAKNEISWLQALEDEHEARKRNNPVIRTRYYVVEITPAYRYATGDGHGGTDYEWKPKQEVIVSNEYNTKEEAKDWMDRHEPDEGKTLEIRYENLRRFTEDRWVSW